MISNLKRTKRSTIVDVAARANVTIATVSHVINGTARISDETAARVNAAISDLNYHPNSHAQALRKPTATTIAYLTPDITTSFYSTFFSTFSKLAYENDFSVQAINFMHNPVYEYKELQNLLLKDVGAVLIHNGFDDAKALELVAEAGIPLILLDRHQEGFSSICYDNASTISSLVKILKLSDYHNIGYISESIVVQNLNDRYIGFLTGMQQCGFGTNLNNVCIYRKPQVDSLGIGYRLMKERISNSTEPLPDVFIASSDLVAFGAIRAIRESGLKVPDDIAITGFDNSNMSAYVQPQLTTVFQSPSEMAEHAWNMLHKLLDSPRDIRLTEQLSQKIVVRESANIPQTLVDSPEFSGFFA